MTAFLALLAILAFLAALHPYTTFPLSLVVLSRLRARTASPESVRTRPVQKLGGPVQAEMAILLCVHNEEAVISRRIENLLELAESIPGTRILVYSDGSTDATVDILKTYGKRITLVDSDERLGKTHGMNLLVARTNARIVVFTDAAVRMRADSLINIVRHFRDRSIGCVCGRIVAVQGSIDSQTTSTENTSVKYWAFDAFIRRMETRVCSSIGAHGPLFAIRHELHESVPVNLIDDFYLSMAILFNGHRVVQAEDVLGFKTVAARREDEFERKIRVACQSFHIHRLMKPRLQSQAWLIRYLYAGHKTLRWLTIVSLACGSLFTTLALLNAGKPEIVFALYSATAAGVLLGYAGIKPFSLALDVLLALVANGIGVVQSMRGYAYQTWSSAVSARQADDVGHGSGSSASRSARFQPPPFGS